MNIRSNTEIFSNIYTNKLWGGAENSEKFMSGPGSHDENIIIPYINLLLQIVVFNDIRSITDVGCGDFWIMRHVIAHLEKIGHKINYSGIDVVEDLVNYNNERFGTENIKFYCLDASEKDKRLPKGDMIIIRQVLQHLNNVDVERILTKADKFKFALITEHIYEGEGVIPNLDNNRNGDIRLGFKSGIYLEKPPFNYSNVVHLLKIAQYGGIIRTSLIIND